MAAFSELFRRLAELEDKSFIESLNTASKIKERHLKRGILISAYDSLVHREVTRALLKALEEIERRPPEDEERKVPDETDVDLVIRAVSRHLEMEYKMIEEVEELLEKLEGSHPAISSFLRAWLADEARHHGILSRIRKELIREGAGEKRMLP